MHQFVDFYCLVASFFRLDEQKLMPENDPPPTLEEPSRRGGEGCVDRSECAVVASQELLIQTAKIKKIGQRSSMVHSLLASYRLLTGMRLLTPPPITNEELRTFHSEDYVAFLEQPDQFAEEDFGCGYDCPVVADLADFARVIAAGTIAAADALVSGVSRVAINWHGGWHHAKVVKRYGLFGWSRE